MQHPAQLNLSCILAAATPTHKSSTCWLTCSLSSLPLTCSGGAVMNIKALGLSASDVAGMTLCWIFPESPSNAEGCNTLLGPQGTLSYYFSGKYGVMLA